MNATTQDTTRKFYDVNDKIENEHVRHSQELVWLEEQNKMLPYIPENMTRIDNPLKTLFVRHGRYGGKHRHNSLILGVEDRMLFNEWEGKACEFLSQLQYDISALASYTSELFRIRFKEYAYYYSYRPLRMNQAHQEREERRKENRPMTDEREDTATYVITLDRHFNKPDTMRNWETTLKSSNLELEFWCEFPGLPDLHVQITLPERLFLEQLDSIPTDHVRRADGGKQHVKVWSFSTIDDLQELNFDFNTPKA